VIGVTFSKNDHDYCLLYQFLGWEFSFNLPDFDFTLGEVYATLTNILQLEIFGLIMDPSLKGDVLSKLIAFLQTSWFIIQAIARRPAAGIGANGIGACYPGASKLERGDLCDLVTGSRSRLDCRNL